MRDPKNFAWPLLALVVLSTVGLTGCGDDDSPTSPSATVTQDVSGVIANNHGHSVVITGAEVTAGRSVAKDIRGNADHSHMLELTNDDIVRLQQRQRVERDATANNTHTHRVTFN